MQPRMTRRRFLQGATALTAGALAVPTLVPSSALGNPQRAAPSDRIAVGCIGTGNRGSAVMGGFLGQRDAQIVAVCDVKTWVREAAQKRVDQHYGSTECTAYNDFRALLARKDIDAVLIANTDHWHVRTAIAAADSGKDMYLEKPMGLSMAQCAALREAIHRNKRVFQFGTQQRSDRKFRLACELARNAKIGKLHTINVWSPGSSAGGPTDLAPVPSGLDYDLWLGPAPFSPYTKDRCSNSWWWFISDYALGFIAGWGIHPLDIAVWGAGDKIQCPVDIEGKGEFPTGPGVCDTAKNWRITMKYASGITLNFTGDPRPQEWIDRYPGSQSHGTAFEGTEGWVHVNRAVVNSSPDGLIETKLGPSDVSLYESSDHVRNLLDCVKSRKDTICPIDEAVRSETLCQIGDIAIRLDRKLKWDPKTETFPDDEEANRRLARPMRAPWQL